MKNTLHISALVLSLGLVFAGCGGNNSNNSSNNNDDINPVVVTAFSTDVNSAFNQAENDDSLEPQELEDETSSFDELLED